MTLTIPPIVLYVLLFVAGSLVASAGVWLVERARRARETAEPPRPARRLSGIQQEGPDGLEPAETPLPREELVRRLVVADFPNLTASKQAEVVEEILQQAARLGLRR